MMTRWSCSLLVVWLSVGQALASDYEQASRKALRSLGEPVRFCPKVVSTKELLRCKIPDQIAVQSVVPRQLSPATIATLLRMGGLDSQKTFKGNNRGVFGTPGVKYYGSLEQTHTLTIIPAQGWIRYGVLAQSLMLPEQHREKKKPCDADWKWRSFLD